MTKKVFTIQFVMEIYIKVRKRFLSKARDLSTIQLIMQNFQKQSNQWKRTAVKI